MEYTVRLIEPAGLLIDEVAEISSGLGSQLLIEGLAADAIIGWCGRIYDVAESVT